MTTHTHSVSLPISEPGGIGDGIRVRSGFWRGQGSEGRAVFLPRNLEPFARSSFVPNITVTLSVREPTRATQGPPQTGSRKPDQEMLPVGSTQGGPRPDANNQVARTIRADNSNVKGVRNAGTFPPGSRATAPTGSGLTVGRSRWVAGDAVCEEELTVAPLGTSTLVQLRAVLAADEIRAEVVATVLDRDLPIIAEHIRDFISELDFSPAGSTQNTPPERLSFPTTRDEAIRRQE
jgi:hypothetical protein